MGSKIREEERLPYFADEADSSVRPARSTLGAEGTPDLTLGCEEYLKVRSLPAKPIFSLCTVLPPLLGAGGPSIRRGSASDPLRDVDSHLRSQFYLNRYNGRLDCLVF